MMFNSKVGISASKYIIVNRVQSFGENIWKLGNINNFQISVHL